MPCCSTLHINQSSSKLTIISIQKHLSYCQKINFNQNFNLIVDAARPPVRHTDQRQFISQNVSLKNPAKKETPVVSSYKFSTKNNRSRGQVAQGSKSFLQNHRLLQKYIYENEPLFNFHVEDGYCPSFKGRGPGINSSQSENDGKIQLSMQLSLLSIILEKKWF